jgi:hypothetical protein
MVETPLLERKRKWAKWEQNEHEPNKETTTTILSYPRKRVSSGFFFQMLSWIPTSAGMTKEKAIKTEVG